MKGEKVMDVIDKLIGEQKQHVIDCLSTSGVTPAYLVDCWSIIKNLIELRDYLQRQFHVTDESDWTDDPDLVVEHV